eukprot:gene5877-11204_t
MLCTTSIKVSQGYSVSCPVCGFEFSFPVGGVYGLVKNNCMLGVMAKVEASRDSNIHTFDCEFCDCPVAKATAMCETCNYWYCSSCLETMHPHRGPLSSHVIIQPREKLSPDEVVPKCEIHSEKDAGYFCIRCNVVGCKICRHQIHKEHNVVELVQYCKREKELVAKHLQSVEEASVGVQGKCDDYERLFAFLKTVANETEAHVKRETDKLIFLIKKKREELLEDVSKAYQIAACKISEGSQSCQQARIASESLSEYIAILLEERNSLHFLQVVKPMTSRLAETTKQLASLAKPDWSIATQFNNMTIDLAMQRQAIDAISWLEAPGPPMFVVEECFGRNCRVHLRWLPPEGPVESYILTAKVLGNGDDFSVVYEGKEAMFVLDDVAYGCKVYARVSARNNAGEGPPSDDILVTMPLEFDFQFSHELTSLDISLSTDLRSIKTLKDSPSIAIGDTLLTSGIHYWCARVTKAPCRQNCKLGFGIITQRQLEQYMEDGAVRSTYEVEIPLSDDTHDQELSSNKILFKRSVYDIKDMVLEFILNLSAGYFDIYTNGTLISSGGSGSTFANIFGKFYPCVLTTGKGLRVDFISQLEVLHVTPGPPEILHEKCFVKNTEITVVWKPGDEVNHDLPRKTTAYIVEMKYIGVNDRRFQEIYRGCKTWFTFDASEYKAKIKVRVSCVNHVGIGSPSEEMVFQTPKGLCFKFDTGLSYMASAEPKAVKISSNGVISCESNHEESCFLGDVVLSKGCHSWGFKIRYGGEKLEYIAFGLAKESNRLEDICHQSASCFAMCTNGSKLLQNQLLIDSKNIIIQQVTSLEEMHLVVVFDVDSESLRVYLNGLLIHKVSDLEISMPTFRNVARCVRPAVWIRGGMVQIVPLTELETPGVPGSPVINEHNSQVTENSLRLEWAVRSLDCVDFFIVEMAVLHNSVVGLEPEEFQEVFRGNRTKFESKNLPYNSEISCRVFSVNGKGKSKVSPLFKGSTCRGLKFEFDKTTGHPDLVIKDAWVSLTSPVYATVLGNVSLSSNCHYWEVVIDTFDCQNQSAVIGVGIAKRELIDPVLGEDVYSYALQIHQYPKIICQNTANKIQIKRTNKEAEDIIIGIHIDLDAKWMDVYNNGCLVLRKKKDKRSFRIKSGTYYPAFSLYGTNVKISLRTGVDFEERFKL